MNKIAVEIVRALSNKLESLYDQRTAELIQTVCAAIVRIDSPAAVDPIVGVENGWPVGYFAQATGMFADESFERPTQVTMQERDDRQKQLCELFGSCQVDAEDLDAFLAINREQRLISRAPIEL